MAQRKLINSMNQHVINTIAVIILVVSGAALRGEAQIVGLVLGSLLFAFSAVIAKNLQGDKK